MPQKFEKVVQEDLNVGTGMVWIVGPGGGELRATQIGLHSFARGQKQYQATWAPGSIAADGKASTTITVPDATIGDFVIASHTKVLTGELTISGHISAAGIARVVIYNPGTAAVTVASGTLSVLVFPAVGVAIPPSTGTITGVCYHDVGNPGQEAEGQTIELFVDGSPFDTEVSAVDGTYTFLNVTAGEITLSCTGVSPYGGYSGTAGPVTLTGGGSEVLDIIITSS